MLQIDTPVLDLLYGEDSLPTPEGLMEALGGAAAPPTLMVLDVDAEAPQYETEISPTLPLRRRGDRRLLIVDEGAQPMRKNPRAEPIVPKDLRAEKARLVSVVAKTGARLGRLQSFGSWGDAVVVARQPVDLRALALLFWALDPQSDIDGRRRATPLNQREFEAKLAAFRPRLEELDDATILSRIPPANLEQKDGLYIVDVLSDRDGSWDLRKSFEYEKRVAAVDLFARLPGARVPMPAADAVATEASLRPVAPAAPAPAAPAPAAPAPAPAAAAEAPAAPAGPPITTAELAGRVFLLIPADRLDTDTVAALARRSLDWVRASDAIPGAVKDRIHHDGCGFVAPLAFLSEVFVDGKPLDKKRLETDAAPGPEGTRMLPVHLPRFGPVVLLDGGGPGKRWIASETTADPAALLALARRL